MEIIKKRIGIVGGGQLGKMMILEAKRLGFYVTVLDPDAKCPCQSICDRLIVANLDDSKGYIELSKHSDVITYEWENINAGALEKLENEGHLIYHPVATLSAIQNKYNQNAALKNKTVPVPKFHPVTEINEIKELGKKENFGYPLMLKTTTGGYDGKGTFLIKTEDDVENAFKQLGSGVKGLMIEEFIDFEKEISVIACRAVNGESVIYPIAENIHINSILDTTIIPAVISNEVSKKAICVAEKIMSAFEFTGTFCIEMFVTKQGDVYVNEIAPRPHNSGHYTIEACFANQFENHIRAVVGLPLGDASLISPAVMMNLLGESNGAARLLGLEEAYGDPNVHIHIYGKEESKTGRKMGHFTVTGKTREDTLRRAEGLKKIIRVVGD